MLQTTFVFSLRVLREFGGWMLLDSGLGTRARVQWRVLVVCKQSFDFGPMVLVA